MRAWAASALAVLALSGCGEAPSAEGACAGPEVTVSTGQVAPGGELRVQAGPLRSDCYDTGQPGTPPPQQDVVIALWPEGASYGTELMTVDADEDGRIDVTVRIPGDVPAGRASLHVGPAIEPIMVTAP